jgi:hypothetical protein
VKYRLLLLLLMLPNLMLVGTLRAEPALAMCQFECTEQQQYQLQADTWQRIDKLFDAQLDSAAERAAIANALALMEQDILGQVKLELGEEELADYLQQMFANLDETRNTRSMIILLSDRQLIRNHVIRRSEKRQAVFGPTQLTAVIQSIDDGRVYAVDATTTGFGFPPQISLLGEWKQSTPVRKLGGQIKTLFNDLTGADEQDTSHE